MENPSDPGSVPLAVTGVTPGLGSLGDFTESVEMLRYGALTYPHLLEEDRMWKFSLTLDYALFGHITLDGTRSACEAAAYLNKFDVLIAARALGCPWGYTATLLCLWGRVDILRWARSNHQVEKVPLTASCYTIASNVGHIEVIKFLWAEHCPFESLTPYGAAEHGHVECLRLLHEIHSHLPIDDDGIVPAIQWQAPEVCEYAVKSGNLETLEVAWSLRGEHYDIMFPFPEGPYPMLAAIKIGRLDMIKFLLTKGCPWGRDTCEAVRNAGHPHVSLWVEKNLGVCPSITVDQVFGACSEHGDGL